MISDTLKQFLSAPVSLAYLKQNDLQSLLKYRNGMFATLLFDYLRTIDFSANEFEKAGVHTLCNGFNVLPDTLQLPKIAMLRGCDSYFLTYSDAWWLQDSINHHIAYVHGNGLINYHGQSVYSSSAIRPILKLCAIPTYISLGDYVIYHNNLWRYIDYRTILYSDCVLDSKFSDSHQNVDYDNSLIKELLEDGAFWELLDKQKQIK